MSWNECDAFLTAKNELETNDEVVKERCMGIYKEEK